MSIKTPTKGGKEFQLVPEGSHIARVYQLIHIGTIKSEWQGQTRDRDVVRIAFELPNELRKFGDDSKERPMVINTGNLTNTMGEKGKLRPLVQGIIGTKLDNEEAEFFELTDIVGIACMLTVIHEKDSKGIMRDRISSTAPLPKGMTAPAAINEPFILDFNENWSDIAARTLPQFLQDMIASSREYKAMKGVKEPSHMDEDSGIPW
jgi:hypothetical protein